jgi:hypothetical protein
LVRTVTKALGGTVRVSDRGDGNRADGTGTQFEVTLSGVIPPRNDTKGDPKPDTAQDASKIPDPSKSTAN